MRIIKDLEEALSEDEQIQAKSIIRYRNEKSEAHLVKEMPSREELALCKKMAYSFIIKEINIFKFNNK